MAEPRNPFFPDTEVSAAEDYTGAVLPWAYDYATDTWKPAIPRIVSDAAKATKRAAELPTMNLWDVVGSPDFGKARRDISDIPTEFLLDAWMPGGAAAATKFGVVGDATLGTIKGYHGTPYRFEPVDHNPFGEFKDEAIGSGEGAQAYGWGHYVAGREGTAKYYQGAGTADLGTINVGGKEYKGLDTAGIVDKAFPSIKEDTELSYPMQHALNTLRRGSNLEETVADLRYNYAHYPSDKIDEVERLLLSANPQVNKEGSLYTIDIDLEPEQLLDWDAPLAQQPEAIRKLVEQLKLESPLSLGLRGMDLQKKDEQLSGNLVYRALSQLSSSDDDLLKELGKQVKATGLRGNRAASAVLAEAGIPGIKYLDQGSRLRPFNEIKEQFLRELPEDADFDELRSLYGTGKFSPEQETFLKALEGEDWLGFDYPSQAISAALRGSPRDDFDIGPELLKARKALQEKNASWNYVIFDPKHLKITARNGVPLERVEYDPFTRDLERQLDAAKRTGNRGMIEQIERQLKKARNET